MKKTKVNYNFDVKKEIVESFTFEKNASNHKGFLELPNMTVFIPTIRWEYIQNSINFYRKFSFLKVVYVVNNNIDKSKFIELSSNTKLHYLYDKSHFNHWIYGLKEVQTKLVLICADDDFIDVNELIEGYFFLNLNQRFKVYYGPSQSFIFDSRNEIMFNSKWKLKKDRIIDQMDFNEKCKLFFKPYENILWSLFDRKELLRVYNFINSFNPINHNLFEFSIATYFLSQGSIFISNNIWNYRRKINNSWGTKHATLSIDEEFVHFQKELDSLIGSKVTNQAMEIYLNNIKFGSYKKFFILSNYVKYLKKKSRKIFKR